MAQELDRIIIEADEDAFTEEQSKKTVRVLVFRLDTEHYCIHITTAKEVFIPAAITKVPNTPAFIIGVTNLHGEVIPLVDLRYFLGLRQKEGLGGTKALVTDVKSNTIGIMVDDVDEALDIEEVSIQPPLATIKGRLAEFTIGQIQLSDKIAVLLDLKKILNCNEMENLKKG